MALIETKRSMAVNSGTSGGPLASLSTSTAIFSSLANGILDSLGHRFQIQNAVLKVVVDTLDRVPNLDFHGYPNTHHAPAYTVQQLPMFNPLSVLLHSPEAKQHWGLVRSLLAQCVKNSLLEQAAMFSFLLAADHAIGQLAMLDQHIVSCEDKIVFEEHERKRIIEPLLQDVNKMTSMFNETKQTEQISALSTALQTAVRLGCPASFKADQDALKQFTDLIVTQEQELIRIIGLLHQARRELSEAAVEVFLWEQQILLDDKFIQDIQTAIVLHQAELVWCRTQKKRIRYDL